MTDKTQPSALPRYKIGCHSDEWGQRSSTPSGIPDPQGPWVRFEDAQKLIARVQQHEAELAAIGAGGVSGPLLGQPQAMPDLSQLTERGAKAWAGVDAQALRDGTQAPPVRDTLRAAAQAVVDRWDTPLWKDVPATAEYIGRLRAAIAAQAPRCNYCDGTGDVHSPTGEWRGECTACDAAAPKAPQQAAPAVVADPMDWPLPCDVTVGHGTMCKGVSLRTLVARMKVLYEMATGNNADEVANRTPEENTALVDAFRARIGASLQPSSTPQADSQPSSGAVAGPILAPSAFVNAAGIKADDKPGTVVRKLDAAFHDAVTFSDAAQGDALLWCVHVQGPDDVHAMSTRAEALDRANELNELFGRHPYDEGDLIMRAVVIEWPHSAASHAAELAIQRAARAPADSMAAPQQEVQRPVATQWLAEMIMSDCGCSTQNQRLHERIIERIVKYECANAAQPAPSGDAWKDGDTAALVNALRDVAVQYRDTQQLRERIAHIVRPLAARAAPSGDAWTPVAERLPEHHTPVLLDIGKKYPIRAMWVTKGTLPVGLESDSVFGEYDERTDEWYCPEGWYEWNQHEECHWAVSEKPLAWTALPELDAARKEGNKP